MGNDEREAAISALGERLSTGHLEMHEYTERVDAASSARTAAELDALFTDLPGPHQMPPGVASPAVGAPYPAPGPTPRRTATTGSAVPTRTG